MTKALLDSSCLPGHLAIIMDGNGRWAKQKGKPRSFGHQAGGKALKNIIREVFSLGIPYLSLYVFSVDNWKREKTEIKFLMRLIKHFYKKEFPEIHAQGIKILHSGIYPPLPEETIKILEKVAWETKDNTKGTLNLCINYGGRVEILEGIKKVLLDMESGKIQASALDTGFFRNYLFQPGVPDVDFMIRTSGEERISDFLLWQSAYAELYFTQTLWPDFDAEELYKALQVYQARERRYGGAQS